MKPASFCLSASSSSVVKVRTLSELDRQVSQKSEQMLSITCMVLRQGLPLWATERSADCAVKM